VLLEILVGELGRVQTIRLSRSSGVASLDRAALETVRRWRFEPARRGGRAVAFTVSVPVRFVIRDARPRSAEWLLSSMSIGGQ
jgi:protein TonB